MSVPTDPNSDLSMLCLSTATADQAGRSEHLLSLSLGLNVYLIIKCTSAIHELCAIALAIHHTYITLE